VTTDIVLEYLVSLGVPGLAGMLLWAAGRAVWRFFREEAYPQWVERQEKRLMAEIDLAVSLALLTERIEYCHSLMIDVRATLTDLLEQ
jgi:hypothetical protein